MEPNGIFALITLLILSLGGLTGIILMIKDIFQGKFSFALYKPYTSIPIGNLKKYKDKKTLKQERKEKLQKISFNGN